MSEEGGMHFSDAFRLPAKRVRVDCLAPMWRASLRREHRGFSTLEPGTLTLTESEMSPAMAATWGKDDGWAALATRFRAVAEVLGGNVELHSYKGADGAEWHEVQYLGDEVWL